MTAWMEPASTTRSRLSVATSPPKRLTSPVTASRVSAMGCGLCRAQPAIDAALGEQHDQHQDRPEDELPMLGVARQDFFQREQREGADDRPDQAAEPAQYH